ncbi:7171_t:CDS:1, partial [Cetraspora pellucida]
MTRADALGLKKYKRLENEQPITIKKRKFVRIQQMNNRTSTAKGDNTHLSTSKADMTDFTLQANITKGHPTLDSINDFNGNWADEINKSVNTQQSAPLNSTMNNNENSENSLVNTHTLCTEAHDSDINSATYCADYDAGTLNQLPK